MTSHFDVFPWFKNFNINPVTDWQRFINPQFNVTVNQGDAAIENHVLARAGSYGRQLGRMQEVLDMLIARMPPPPLSDVEARSIEKYRQIRSEVVAAVDEAKPAEGAADLDRWLDDLAALRENDPEQFARVAARVRLFIDEPSAAERARAPRGRKRK